MPNSYNICQVKIGKIMQYSILHILVHCGGGVGSVLMNWIKIDKENKHTILCLNHNYYNTYDPTVVYERMGGKYSEINEWVKKSDIVITHFWNHPLLFEFLINSQLPKCRIAFWSHVSGLNPPYVFSQKLIDFSDVFVFSSPISYETKEIKELLPESKLKLKHIWTTGNIEQFSNIIPIPHKGFNIGCTGQLDYSKLHPNFVDLCSRINIPDVKFIMIGIGCDSEKIQQQVKDKGIEDKFIFTGIIKDIKPYLAIIDVLGYPLNPNHFGTCEQVIGEAIAAGIIPIVMKNPAEEYILLQSLIKFVCHDEQEYIHTMELLYRERDKKKKIITFMQEQVIKLYDTNKMILDWNEVFNNLIGLNKRKRIWNISNTKIRTQGNTIFTESLGNYGQIFENNDINKIKKLYASNLQWYSKSKGSPKQYLETFQNDNLLKEWVNLLD